VQQRKIITEVPSFAANAKASPTAAICAKELSFEYAAGSARSVKALDRIDLTIFQGEFVSILGPSGCGKSTLLYIIGGFIPYTSGSLDVCGKPVKGPGPDRGIVFQQFALFPWKTVLQNVLYGLEQRRMPRAERLERANHFIRLVQLDGFENHFPAQLSGGMRQRAALARTLAVDPDILLMDEPFGALDAQTRSILQNQLLDIWRDTKKTIVFVTHDVREAVYLSQRVVLMSKRPGRIKEIIDTDLPDKDDLTGGVEFNKSVDYIWNNVRNEYGSANE
jgi:NitT/TauT family transport system ATP-binding protein